MKIGPLEIKLSFKQNQRRKENRRAYYESASSTGYMAKHWTKSDSRDVNGPILESLGTVRNRCRYEIANNGLAIAAATALADAVVGEGPRLQFNNENTIASESIEKRFAEWCEECDFRGIQTFGQILRMSGVMNQVDSGEGFIVMKWTPLGLRLLCVESDRIATPMSEMFNGNIVEGIDIGDEGIPIRYALLRKHPGDYLTSFSFDEYDWIDADQVIHIFRPMRPGQFRGFPWLSPVLNTFAELRSFAGSVLTAADIGARLSGVLETDSALLPGSTTDDYEAFDPVEIDPGTMVTLPKGLKLSQFKAEQPSATYKEFYDSKLREIGRAFNMPFNIISGDSSSYNYSSGRLDFQTWWKFVAVLQKGLEHSTCDRVFDNWIRDAVLIPGYIDLGGLSLQEVFETEPSWFWPGNEHVDPQKEASAQTERLNNLTTTLASEYAKAGKDWEKELRQIKREKDRMKELGLTPKEAIKGIPNAQAKNTETVPPQNNDGQSDGTGD